MLECYFRKKWGQGFPSEAKNKEELARYNKFQSGVLGIKETSDKKSKDLDIRNYAKYIFKEGAIYEKRELLSCLRSKLVFKDKKLSLET